MYAEWLMDGIKLNIGKTRCVLISSNQQKILSFHNVQVDGAHIKQVCIYVQVLGMMVSQSLSWTNNIDLLSYKLPRGLVSLEGLLHSY